MKRVKSNCALALIIAGMLAAGQAAADKPSWAGGGDKGGKGGNAGQKERPDFQKGGARDNDDRSSRDRAGSGDGTGGHFGDRHRTIVHDYYSEQHRRGHCPPGLAKKDNGCQPPGQAKKWTVGQPLPRDVIFHDLPPELARQFDRPSAGQRYVRVASDILLIAGANGTVIDAIQNLGKM
jgi:Ni/Co efflux regulator RcnB